SWINIFRPFLSCSTCRTGSDVRARSVPPATTEANLLSLLRTLTAISPNLGGSSLPSNLSTRVRRRSLVPNLTIRMLVSNIDLSPPYFRILLGDQRFQASLPGQIR